MAKPILDDALWELIEPLLPPPKKRRRRYPGRKPIPHRAALTGILYVLKSGIPWEMLPKELGCGSGMSCWRWLHDWQAAGVWKKVHRMILNALQAADTSYLCPAWWDPHRAPFFGPREGAVDEAFGEIEFPSIA